MTALAETPASTRRSKLDTVGTVLGSSRPISWINTAFPFGAAYLLVGGEADVAFWVGVVFFLVPYNLAMYGINDVFDYESDLRNPRKGGVEGLVLDRAVHRTTLWSAALSCLPFLVVLLALGGPWSALTLAVSMFAVVA
jgi:4-hydroxybenzoate polyprenyltransferase